MKNAILVPLDGTVQAEKALPVAVAVALRTGAVLHPVLVHLTDYTRELFANPPAAPEADRELSRREDEYLEHVAERIGGTGLTVHEPVVLHGEVSDALVEHVSRRGIDGVVMTTHARSKLERVLAPSVAQGLRRRLIVPMIFVRSDASPPLAADADLGHPAPLHTVLAALDGSADAEVALEQAIEIGGRSARYVLLRVVSLPPQLSSLYLPQATILYHQDEEALRAEAVEYLTAMEERLRPRIPDLENRTGVHSRPGHLIVGAAAEVGADLIAAGSHGHGALRETIFGSTTNDVVRESPVPVLVTCPAEPDR